MHILAKNRGLLGFFVANFNNFLTCSAIVYVDRVNSKRKRKKEIS